MRAIVCTMNGVTKYFDQAKALLQSLYENSPNERVFMYLVNYKEGEEILKKINPNCKVIHYNTKQIIKDVRGFMSNFRTFAIKDALEKNKDGILYMDCDTLVRKDLSIFWDNLFPNVLKIIVRDKSTGYDLSNLENPEDCRVQGGVFGVGNSDATINMISDYKQRVDNTPYFMGEQRFLYECLKEHTNVKHIQLDKKFNEWDFNNDSYIWHCKAKHFNNIKYQKEYKKYLENANRRVAK